MRERPSGLTIQLEVADVETARRFYSEVFGSGPLFEPHEDFLEWRILDTETWVQAVGVRRRPRPLATRLRFRVTDVPAMHARVTRSGGTPTAVTRLPGVVRFFDFSDPWGNQLGYYEDLAPSGQQPAPGGSVHDTGQFLGD